MHVIRLHVTSCIFALVAVSSVASAHVAIGSGPATANKSQKITLEIGHGCDGLDTMRVRIDIPAGITSVRALTSDFGKPLVAKNVDGDVTSVTWEKPATEIQTEDVQFYELTFRARIGDLAFTQLPITVIQTCRDANGDDVVVPWDQPPGSTTGEPAPVLTIVPSHQRGWNKIVAPRTIAESDLGLYFGDALIVWRGTQAFSSNPNTMEQIGATPGVSLLTGDIQAGDELWVRY